MSDTDINIPSNAIQCKNCGNNFEGKFCPSCGQKVINERNTVKHFFKLLFASFDIDRGIIYTARVLFTYPDIVVHDYLNGKTVKYYNPLKYLIVVAGIYAILMIGFNIFESNIASTNELMGEYGKQTQLQQTINSYTKKYLSIIPIIMIPFFSIVSKWVFSKHKLFYGEHLLINTYLYAQYLLITTVIVIIIAPFDDLFRLLFPFGFVILAIYYAYATKKIFDTSLISAFIKSLIIIVLGMAFFLLVVVILSMLVFTILALLGYDIKEMVS